MAVFKEFLHFNGKGTDLTIEIWMCYFMWKCMIVRLNDRIRPYLIWVTKMLEQVWRFLVLHFQLASSERTYVLYFLYEMISLDAPGVCSWFYNLSPRRTISKSCFCSCMGLNEINTVMSRPKWICNLTWLTAFLRRHYFHFMHLRCMPGFVCKMFPQHWIVISPFT